MKTAIGGILVLRLTVWAHGELVHGCLGPIVGDVLDDGEARPAVGAVDEGIAVAPVPSVEHLLQAIRAGGDVRRDQLVGARLRQALQDDERVAAIR